MVCGVVFDMFDVCVVCGAVCVMCLMCVCGVRCSVFDVLDVNLCVVCFNV